ncbi:hypothetical protein ASO14_1809 [Kurthia sp. 11kri321]|uniref:hypothetical protein n=1 Tax=Kurthia sp. 11kri321 TaxID=1750719 RepID=UPI000745D507|nr:hypothetical protein [Kurthia sp. 11kri321]AMA62307.1 hypothetical protein ASO14_1809 [Kurthia sp. 11kri321]
MRMKFEIEPYEDMLDEPFEVSSYFLDRINMYIEKNNRMEEFCTSTFHSSILLDLAEGLINMYEQNQQPFVIEMFESTYEYTFTYFQKLLTITRYEGYNGETIEMMKCRFDDFVEAFVKEYERYHKAILKQDRQAFENEHYCMMRDQINILKNHVNGVI